MKQVLFLILFVFLTGCKTTTPSEAITNSAIQELKGITSELKTVEAQLPSQCQDVVKNGLKPIYEQIDIIQGEVKNISLSCNTEKQVLEHKIEIRNLIIFFLLVAVAGYFFFRIKYLLTGK